MTRIAAVETVQHDDYPHVLHVLIHGDDGAFGTGETLFDPDAVAEYVHTTIAPRMLGESATNVTRMWQLIGQAADGRQPWSGTASVNSSATSAFDIAMWDLRAKQLGVPLHEALGGAARDRIRLYNTCADAGHLPPPGTPRHERHLYEDWGLGGPRGSGQDDWTASLERPGELARELVDEGITAMKIYPFMRLGRETRGLFITPQQLEENLEPFRAIREAVGPRIDLCVDLVSMWAYGPALQIATSLEPFGLMWLEDPLRISAIGSLGHLARVVRIPIAGYDCRAGLAPYVDLVESGAVSIVRVDPQWVGGVSEVCRIASYAEGRGLGIVLHDCGGPVQWAAGVHTALHLPNAMILEFVRTYHRNIYPTMVDAAPAVVAGHAVPPDAPGHGAALLPSYLESARRRRSTVRGGRFVTETVG